MSSDLLSEGILISPEDLLSKILKKSTEKKEGSFEDVPQTVIELAQTLIATCPELSNANGASVKYLFKTGSWSKWGECNRTTGKWRKLTGFDFVIVLHKDSWMGFTPEQQQALLHHELCHIDRLEDKWCLAKHDVEEFLSTFKRYKSWNASLEAFKVILVDVNSGVN